MCIPYGDFPESIARTQRIFIQYGRDLLLSEETDTEHRALIHNDFKAVMCTTYSEINKRVGKRRLKRAYILSFCLRVV